MSTVSLSAVISEPVDQYDIVVRFSPVNGPAAAGPPFLVALEEQLGLKLEPATIPMETVVVHRVERPAAN